MFIRCPNCQLVFKDPSARLSKRDERSRYAQHDNRIDNPGYADFLTPAMNEVLKRKPVGSRGLDYGCGPGPVLAKLLNDAGYSTAHYDPFFFPERTNEQSALDFITCTEALEHFFNPGAELEILFQKLRPNGVLVLMTELYQEGELLEDWYYTRDPTHVSFYSDKTLHWIAGHFGGSLDTVSRRLHVFSVI